jgi:hypothetical protein
MSVRRYLPSAQFGVMVAALAIATGLVTAAHYYTTTHDAPPSLASAADVSQSDDWQSSLEDVQAASGQRLPEAPSGDSVTQLYIELSERQPDRLCGARHFGAPYHGRECRAWATTSPRSPIS